jgi:hypothetical protein
MYHEVEDDGSWGGRDERERDFHQDCAQTGMVFNNTGEASRAAMGKHVLTDKEYAQLGYAFAASSLSTTHAYAKHRSSENNNIFNE